MLLVKDIMKKSPRYVMPETSLAEAMLLMQFYKMDGLPVAINKEFIGFIQLRDVLAMLFPESSDQENPDTKQLQIKLAPILRVEVKQIMGDAISSVSPSLSVYEAVSIMLEKHTCSLAVTEGEKLVGSISFDDVNKAILGLNSAKVAA
jgi:predicted transcriptional regulator